MGRRQPPLERPPSMDRVHRAEIVDRLYAVALDPIRLEELLDVWENHVGPLRVGTGGPDGSLNDHELEAHLHRASVFLDRFDVTRQDGGYRSVLADIPRTAAFVSDGGPTIIGFNRPAELAFQLGPEARMLDLPFEAEDIMLLRDAIGRVASGREEKVITLRIRALRRETPVILRIGPLTSGDTSPLALILSTELVWPDGFETTVQEAFGLTAAEVDIVRGITMSLPVKEIAKARGRSAETVRAQLRSILAKTETHSQQELVRIVLGLMDLEMLPAAAAQPLPKPGAVQPVVFYGLEGANGRRLTWIEFGAAFGAPCLLVHTDYGLIRWPAAAELAAQRLGIRVIVPVRAGFGDTDPLAAGEDQLEGVTRDYLAVIDHLNLRRVAVLAMGSSLRFALNLSRRRTGLVTGILGCACQLPLQNPAQFERMDKWQRFTAANARHAPKILPFVVKAGFSLARRMGKEHFFGRTNGGSPADMHTIAQPEVREALLAGSEIVLSEHVLAHEAFAAECGGAAQDWSGLIHGAQVPVRLLQGDQDPMTPMQTVREVEAEFPQLDVAFLPNAGQLLFFAHWRQVLQELERFLPRL